MSLIEQAAKRLEELRRAGAQTSDGEAAQGGTTASSVAKADHTSTPEAAMRYLAAQERGLAKQVVADHDVPARRAGIEVRGAPRSHRPALHLDLNRLSERGFVTPDAKRSRLKDEFRIVKRPIVRNALGHDRVHNGNLVMITSALPGEGKTFTTINLAMSIAMEVGTTVTLVDGDVAHPDIPNILGSPEDPGLLELLTADDLDFDDVVVPTTLPNVSILPAGAHQQRATELLASEQMAVLLRTLTARYADRVFIFDSPPLLPTTEARVLASQMGQIVMVVAADSTRQQTVDHALETIERCPIVQMLLNKAEKTEVGNYYGYGYGDVARR
jgi:receptor protein-tyrosine kinase